MRVSGVILKPQRSNENGTERKIGRKFLCQLNGPPILIPVFPITITISISISITIYILLPNLLKMERAMQTTSPTFQKGRQKNSVVTQSVCR